MNREYSDFLQDMLENAERAIEFTKGMDYQEKRATSKLRGCNVSEFSF